MMMQTWQTCTWLAVLKWLQLLLLPMLHNRGMSPTEQPAPLVDQMHLIFVNSLPHTLMLLNLYMLMPDLAHAQCLCCLCVRPRHNSCLSDAVCSCYCSPSYSVQQNSMYVDSITTLATLLVPALWSKVSSEVPDEQTEQTSSQTERTQAYAQTCDEKWECTKHQIVGVRQCLLCPSGPGAVPDPSAVSRDDFIMQSAMPEQAEAQSSAVDNDRLSQLRRRGTNHNG